MKCQTWYNYQHLYILNSFFFSDSELWPRDSEKCDLDRRRVASGYRDILLTVGLEKFWSHLTGLVTKRYRGLGVDYITKLFLAVGPQCEIFLVFIHDFGDIPPCWVSPPALLQYDKAKSCNNNSPGAWCEILHILITQFNYSGRPGLPCLQQAFSQTYFLSTQLWSL